MASVLVALAVGITVVLVALLRLCSHPDCLGIDAAFNGSIILQQPCRLQL